MRATSFNHVSVSAPSLEDSVRFYTEVFRLEKIPTPNFGFPVQWLRLGDLQLHLFQKSVEPMRHHHFAVEVDDFEAVYTRVMELGVQDVTAFGHHLYELPGGCVQLYLRDPGANLVEVNWPDVNTLDLSLISDLRRLGDVYPQTGDNLRSSLFLAPRAGVSGGRKSGEPKF